MADMTAEKRWQRKGAAVRREEILTAATALFAQQGFERTTTRAIAQQAGVSEGTIFKYFDRKEEILFALVHREAIQPLSTLIASLVDADDVTIIRAIIADRFERWDRWRSLLRALFSEMVHNPALAQAFHEAIARPALMLLESYLTRRIAEGAFRPCRVDIVARAFIGHLIGVHLAFEGPLGGQKLQVSREELVDELAALFLHGLRRPDAPAPEGTA